MENVKANVSRKIRRWTNGKGIEITHL